MTDLHRIIWLASYPKSGNTWLRSFLAKYFTPPDAGIDINSLRRFTTGDSRTDFFEKATGRSPYAAKDFDDWLLTRQKVLRLIAASKPHPHFVKTHQAIERIGPHALVPPEVTAGAVYVIRNPFDVAQSYSRHMNVTHDEAIETMADPKNIIRTPNNIFEVLGRWDRHIDGWTGAPGLHRHVVRYEDMAADAERTFRALLRFLNAPIKDGPLRRAVRETSFAKLKAEENAKGFIERPAHMEAFFARGRAGSWREELTPAQVARVRAHFLPAIEKWYPEMLEETADVAARA